MLEVKHKTKPSSPLILEAQNWKKTQDGLKIDVTGYIKISNVNRKIEVMIPELTVSPILLSPHPINNFKLTTQVYPQHSEEPLRKDGYWYAYIVKSNKSTMVKVQITIEGINIESEPPKSLWVDIKWVNYGPFGYIKCRNGFLVTLEECKKLITSESSFIEHSEFDILPIKTHLLGTLDNTVEVLDCYTRHIRKPGDIITIGETPVAIMQNRYRHPSTIRPSKVALILCKAFHPTSSLATACGLQSLIDIVGPSRVTVSVFLGILLKLIGIKGGFYRLAGDQARLIDDITGTTPPYDQNIVLGPYMPKKICMEAARTLGVDIAIVDVNDLGRVKILASSTDCNEDLLVHALRSNPAGNANEQTPIVLVRPKN